MALSVHSLEANVPDNFNLTTLIGDTIGELKFYGQGAGSLPTGNAIVSDLIAICRQEPFDVPAMSEKRSILRCFAETISCVQTGRSANSTIWIPCRCMSSTA